MRLYLQSTSKIITGFVQEYIQIYSLRAYGVLTGYILSNYRELKGVCRATYSVSMEYLEKYLQKFVWGTCSVLLMLLTGYLDTHLALT